MDQAGLQALELEEETMQNAVADEFAVPNVVDRGYRLLDLTVYGRQEDWEDSPVGWPQSWGEANHPFRRDGRPISQWSRLQAGHSDDLGSNRV